MGVLVKGKTRNTHTAQENYCAKTTQLPITAYVQCSFSFYIFFRQLGRWSESNDQEPFRDLVLAGVGAGRHVFLARVNEI
jgi:hypothetical protein